MIEEYVKEIKQCADHITTNNKMINFEIKRCLLILDKNSEELTNADIDEVRGILLKITRSE